jgi:hypothetical protein
MVIVILLHTDDDSYAAQRLAVRQARTTMKNGTALSARLNQL